MAAALVYTFRAAGNWGYTFKQDPPGGTPFGSWRVVGRAPLTPFDPYIPMQ